MTGPTENARRRRFLEQQRATNGRVERMRIYLYMRRAMEMEGS